MHHLRFISIVGLLSAGCGIKEDKFIDQFAEAYCGHIEDCGKISEQYGTFADCETAARIIADEELAPKGCSYNPKTAKTCLEDTEANEDCDVQSFIPDSCSRVASCGGDTGQ